MNIKEYAEDVGKTSKEIFDACDKLGISYENEESFLSQEDIILLDNSVETIVDEEEIEDEMDEEIEEEEKLVELAKSTKIDIENETNFEKFNKSKRQQESKKQFLKDKKKIYKHKESLQSVDSVGNDIIVYHDGMSVSDIAKELNVSNSDVIKKLMSLGVMASVNQEIDFDTAQVLVELYEKKITSQDKLDVTNFEEMETIDNAEDLVTRPPVVTIMGHVDHGKTTLLDTIRKTNVALGEAGGITQVTSAYSVKYNDRLITFIDTPGHAAFTQMRQRGANITDIIIIIVAADDGVMPQTIEVIDHAKAANCPIIVAINKIDKPGANTARVLTQLTEAGLVPESYGGDIIVNEISAKNNIGIDELLENILLVADMNDYKANPNRYATGVVIESSKSDKSGVNATLLIQNGTLRLSDPIVVGNYFGKIRSMKNDLGQNIAQAGPSTPVEITGLSDVPEAGDKFLAFDDEKRAKQVAQERFLRSQDKNANLKGVSLDTLFEKIKTGENSINVILKADLKGSLEAIKTSLSKIDIEGIKVNFVRAAVGGITESDVILASTSNSIIIGFNTRATSSVSNIAKQKGVTINTYDIIYKLIEDVESSIKGMREPKFEEKVVGELEIRQIFKFSKVGLIAGCHVTSGHVKINSKARLIRDGIVIYKSTIKSLQIEKDQAKEVKNGQDCGLTIDNCQDYKEGDIIEIYEEVEVN